MTKEKTIHCRISESDHRWLTQNATEISSFVRNLIEQARRNDEERPLKERISETQKLLDEAKKVFDVTVGSAYAETPEMQGALNRYTKDVKRLKAKLALLTGT
jgi:F0F1-type ATP synthase delta subunit